MKCDGECICDEDLCGGVCVGVEFNPLHCGDCDNCDNACDAGEICDEEECVTP
ncbi:MAG: hypothetical protein GKR94_31570 [Gammaproteobacteria bacterium]|nr:hypothetical protein [Gammaproteobacteria bacterium]